MHSRMACCPMIFGRSRGQRNGNSMIVVSGDERRKHETESEKPQDLVTVIGLGQM